MFCPSRCRIVFTLVFKHRKNCGCCPGHSLTVSHQPSVSWQQFLNLSGIVDCIPKSKSLNCSQCLIESVSKTKRSYLVNDGQYCWRKVSMVFVRLWKLLQLSDHLYYKMRALGVREPWNTLQSRDVLGMFSKNPWDWKGKSINFFMKQQRSPELQANY